MSYNQFQVETCKFCEQLYPVGTYIDDRDALGTNKVLPFQELYLNNDSGVIHFGCFKDYICVSCAPSRVFWGEHATSIYHRHHDCGTFFLYSYKKIQYGVQKHLNSCPAKQRILPMRAKRLIRRVKGTDELGFI